MDAPAVDSALARSLELSLPPGTQAVTGSVAVSRDGTCYSAGSVGSQTHLLDIPSELAALVRAVQHNDVHIKEVRTVTTDPLASVSPLVLKILADHGTRIGTAMRYVVQDTSGKILFESADVRELLPWYTEPGTALASLMQRTAGPAKSRLDEASGLSIELQLRSWALRGRERNFPTYDAASGYGAAVLTKTGDIYYGGQYSTYEHRLGVHAEMGVLLNALMDGVRDITHIGVASSKFPDTPCSPCGCCRQLMAELSLKCGLSPVVYLFASENEEFALYTLDELLPAQWTNKK
ncbi:MAG: cytidine deaminase [Candidatus Parcubacteria bacterium]|jgi:cytidine deaminase|nr:cytidine deaminase [Candidatus Parcubacteria bacterium]